MGDPIVGIDLGTSNTVVAYADGGSVRVLADSADLKIQPSVVSFHPNGGVIVGAAAKQRKVIDPKNTIYSVKRLVGRSFRSPEVQIARSRVPFEIKEGGSQMPVIVTRGGEFAVPEISAIILDHAKAIATARLGTPVSRAVITVPASFNDAQRSATATAGAIAGLTVMRVLNEPTAAALAYGHARELNQVIAVYDFGGGTFDITILRLQDQVYEVLGTAGDTFLGGDDLDERLVDKMVAKFLSENRVDLRTNEVSMMRLRAVAEQTKIELSRRSRAIVRIDEIAYGPNGTPLNLQLEITRDEFVGHIADIIDKTFPVCREAMSLAGLGVDGIADVILGGGTTKIPYVRDQVSRFFAKAPRTDVNPEDAVAIGAAIQASTLDRLLARPRKTTKSVPVVAIPPRAATTSSGLDATTVTGETTVPGETLTLVDPLASRTTPGYPTTSRTGTAYSVTRAGNRDTIGGVADRGTFEERTPPPAAKPLARISRTGSNTAISDGPPPIPKGSPPPRSTTLPGAAVTAATAGAATMIGVAGTTLPGFAEGPSPGTTAPGMPPPAPAPLVPSAPLPPPTTILEVTPRSLGIGTVAGYCEELIRRNSRVPTEIKKLFTTSRDRQDMVRIVVCQGESRRLDANVVIGDLLLQNLPPRPRGETSIEVTFALDASGILQVRARDADTGKEQSASLDLVGGIGQEDVQVARDRIQQLRR